MKIQAIGIPWYRESDYLQLRSLFKDGDRLPLSYSDWLKAANHTYEQLTLSGSRVEKVVIKSTEFVSWCELNTHQLDAEARMSYASEIAAQRIMDALPTN